MTTTWAIVAIAFLLVSPVNAQLRNSVALVEPVFHQATRQEFSELADYFGSHGQRDWDRFLRWYAGDQGHWRIEYAHARPIVDVETVKRRFEELRG